MNAPTATAAPSKTSPSKLPYFKGMTTDQLRIEYRSYRALAFNNSAAAASGAVNLKRAASQMGLLMHAVELIENIARQRRVSLA